MENFVEDQPRKTLRNQSFLTADSEHEFLIWLIPPKTCHPLRRIVGKSTTGFLLVGASLQDCSDSSNQTASHLARYKNERVPVGTPLSQEVVLSHKQRAFAILCWYSSKEDNRATKGCITEWVLSQENIHPSSLENARYFLSLYANALRGSLQQFEVWVYVDGNNPQGITYLATVPEENWANSTGTPKLRTVEQMVESQ
ncbi:hypothetical protein OS493_037353 [Desmophyllum pertusum]|uniref:Uncharacterized protein n=1 Tax=Desmophyllum pertusum TaxID=174260 RepID=A0A9W9YHZ3_9CNID|nr:hypothetical protein OS493_037353 [Desmophyllum pertusum]